MYGSTNVSEASNLIFTKDNEIQHKLVSRLRPNAPPVELEGDLKPADIDEKDVHNAHIKKLMNTMEDKVFDGKVKLF